MKYIISNGWLKIIGVGETKFFNSKDKEWLDAGGQPKLNDEGYLILPYGHKDGVWLYPELHGKSEATTAKQDRLAIFEGL